MNSEPFLLRSGPSFYREWYCIVAGRRFGQWPDKGSAMAGYLTELRRDERARQAREKRR